MRYIISFLFLLIITNISAQEINKELKTELDSIKMKDQELRKLFTSIPKEEKIEILNKFDISWELFVEKNWKIVSEQDSINLRQISKIIDQYGYPGLSLVGKPTNRTAWYVIQHSNQIDKFFPLIQKAGNENEIPMTLVAMMEDRMLMYNGNTQKYGTQASRKEVKNKKTGETKWISFIWPIEDPKNVNDLRNKIGFDSSIEDYAESMNIEYKVLTLKEVKEMSTY